MFFDSASFGNVKIANFSQIDSEEICDFIINGYSTKPISPSIRKAITTHLIHRPKAKKHLQNRFWFDENKYSRVVDEEVMYDANKHVRRKAKIYALDYTATEKKRYNRIRENIKIRANQMIEAQKD